MARGNRLDPIFLSPKGEDQELFLKTLNEVCEYSIFPWYRKAMHVRE